jgi:hypothetical protein
MTEGNCDLWRLVSTSEVHNSLFMSRCKIMIVERLESRSAMSDKCNRIAEFAMS